MENKNISDVDAFIEEAEKGRNIPLSKEDIKRINDLSREVDSVESEIEDDVISIVAKEKNDSELARFQEMLWDELYVFRNLTNTYLI